MIGGLLTCGAVAGLLCERGDCCGELANARGEPASRRRARSQGGTRERHGRAREQVEVACTLALADDGGSLGLPHRRSAGDAAACAAGAAELDEVVATIAQPVDGPLSFVVVIALQRAGRELESLAAP